MLKLRSRFAVLAAFVIAVAGVAISARADQEDKAAAHLARARTQYERVIQVVRDDLRRGLDARIDAANRPSKVDPEKIKEAASELQAFMSEGAWPDVPGVEAIRKRAADACKQLIDAYGSALAAYAKAGDTSRGDAVRAELEQFSSQSDMVPWGQNLLAEAGRTLDPAAAPLTFSTLAPTYRLEIIAQRKGSTGTLKLSFPAPSRGRVSVDAEPDAAGAFRVLLTVGKSAVSCDLGVPRPLPAGETPSSGEAGIVLSAADAPIEVSLLRMKPVVDGEPPLPQRTAKVDERKLPADPLPSGASGEGKCLHHRTDQSPERVKVTVSQRSGSQATLAVVIPGSGESFRVDCEVRGTSLSVTNVEQTQAPKGSAPFKTSRTLGGSGTIQNGVLNLTWTVRGSSPKIGNNREWEVRLTDVAMR